MSEKDKIKEKDKEKQDKSIDSTVVYKALTSSKSHHGADKEIEVRGDLLERLQKKGFIKSFNKK